ncbi:MAG TPA: aspartyl protease family protein [Rhizomicrobium sp.]
MPIAAGALLLCLLNGAALGDECQLHRLASFDLPETQDGGVGVPASIDGVQKYMHLDTGSPVTGLSPEVAKELGLANRPIARDDFMNAYGQTFTQVALIHSLTIGQMHAEGVRALMWPSPLSDDGSVAGVLGADVLRHYDIDLDFPDHKVGFFSQDHCPGKVVYWAATSVAVIPVRVVRTGHIIVPVTLDGHAFDALFDTGDANMHLTATAGRQVFGLSPVSPGMIKHEARDGEPVTYEHTFGSLELEGITINNPRVRIMDDFVSESLARDASKDDHTVDVDPDYGITSLVLGTGQFRNLHIYIAYGEQKLYISAGSAQPVPAAKNDTISH